MSADESVWLPPSGIKNPSAFRAALTGLFAEDIFSARPACEALETPVLGQAWLFVGNEMRATPNNPDGGAWTRALGWLRDFRQGMNTGARQRPVDDAPERNRPSISNWPEADVWRAIEGDKYDHPSRYKGQRAYPRAGFGLPIQTSFQTRRRGGGRLREPRDYALHWHDGVKEHDRFASALIVKALPLAGRMFVPCALWLTRAYPDTAQVVAVVKGSSVAGTGAAFGAKFTAHTRAPGFVGAAGVDGLRSAFEEWLHYTALEAAFPQLQHAIRTVAP